MTRRKHPLMQPGTRFGRLVTVAPLTDMPWGKWKCQCDCGGTKAVYRHNLEYGNTTSCGCYMRELAEPKELTADAFRRRISYDPKTGEFTYVRSKSDHAGLAAGSYDQDGYWVIRLGQRSYRAHRVAWLLVHGEWPPAHMQMDHIDGNRANNAIANLRLATSMDNARNKRQLPSQSGHRGIYLEKGYYSARIWVNKKSYRLGRYATLEEAVAVRRKAEREHFGEFAPTR